LADVAGWAVEAAVLSETVWFCASVANKGAAAAINHAKYFIFFIKSPYFGFVFPIIIRLSKFPVIHTSQGYWFWRGW
jgi:hypothetical protein